METLTLELDSMDLSDSQKAHLGVLIDSSIHLTILDEVLSNLSDEDKKIFLEKIANQSEHEEIFEFLNQKIDKVEDRIKKVSEDLIKELHEDLKEAKKTI